jgi:AdoMet-dependent heme synthase
MPSPSNTTTSDAPAIPRGGPPPGVMAGGGPAAGLRPRPELLSVDFDERPFTVAWELTRSCALACRHCRAEAQPKPHPDELTTEEAFHVVDEIAELNPPVLVLTGGDPMMRRDLFDIAEYAIGKGLRTSVSPTTTALTTKERLGRLQDLGIQMVHISLDGATEETHDAFRGFTGTFQRAMDTLGFLKELGIGVQVGTTVTTTNLHELPRMAELMAEHGVRMWSLFFLVPTGRGRLDEMITPEQAEETWEWMCDLSETAPFAIRTTAAPQFRRTMLRRIRGKQAEQAASGEATSEVRMTGAGYQMREAPSGVQTRGVNDGKGFVFIDHRGGICPSGFLQLPAGNVRTDSLVDVYRNSKLFTELRDPKLLKGACGRCEFADLCGGSRARAYGVTGDYLADDPLCTIQPE